MRILITGGSGLLGRHLIERLAPNHEILALTRRESPPEAPGGVEWLRQDLLEPLDDKTLPASVDAVVHLAQSSRYRDFPEGAEDIFEVNVHSTFRLLEYGRRAGAKRFVLASTGGVYDFSPEPIDEDGELATPGPYFRSKRISELLLKDYEELFSSVVIRPFFVYGPGPSNMLLSRLARDVLEGETITVDGSPGLLINPIFVTDAARAFERALMVPEGGIYNVAGTESVTITELVRLIAKLADREARLEHNENDLPGALVADVTRMKEVLGAVPEVRLRDGIKKLLDQLDAAGLAGPRAVKSS